MDFSEELDFLKKKSLFRQLKVFSHSSLPWINIDGKKCLLLCSNNYLGLSTHPHLKEASIKAIEKYDCSAAASRLISGNVELYPLLENKIADFKKTESALVFSSGYLANLGVITSLCGAKDIIFSDRLNHASIIDACLLSGAKFKRYPHLDFERLEELLKQSQSYGQRLIVTEGVFSMDGDILPLPKLLVLAKKYSAQIFLDEAHALGVMGKKGRGLEEFYGIDVGAGLVPARNNPNLIRMATFGKAMGSFGAFVAGSSNLINYLVNKARSFIFTTGLPPASLASSLAAFEVLEKEPQIIKKLWENRNFLYLRLKEMGFNTLNSQTPIIPIMIGDNDLTLQFSQRLFEEGVFVQAIRPPTVPKGQARLRVTVMADHTKEDLSFALQAFAKIGRELRII